MSPLFLFASTAGPHIDIKPSPIFYIGDIPITNSILLGLLGYAIVLAMFLYAASAIKRGKKNLLVSMVTWGYETLYSSVEQIVGDKETARRVAPLPITLFFFIIVNYYLGILPFVGPVYVGEGIPLFRGLLADMNVTFALAIVSMVAVQVYAAKAHGFFGNLGRYFVNPFKNPIMTFVGILELIAEFSRLIALSLRLFGNVFAGEVLLIMMGYLTKYAASVSLLPFMIFELFIGAIQAYVFFMLTTVFIALGMQSHGDHDDSHSHSDDSKLQVARNET